MHVKIWLAVRVGVAEVGNEFGRDTFKIGKLPNGPFQSRGQSSEGHGGDTLPGAIGQG